MIYCKRCGGIRMMSTGENRTKDHVECDKADSLERIAMSLETIANHIEALRFK
jgi:hypothetical protein